MDDDRDALRRGGAGRQGGADPRQESLVVRARSLSDQVRAAVERMILDGTLVPNQRVNENALAQALGVSRGPVREACSSLAGMGLMEAVPNRGFFVRALSEEEAQDLAEARSGIFASCARLLAARITPDQLVRLRAMVAEMEAQAKASDSTGYYDMNLGFHAFVAEHCGNRRLGEIYAGLVRDLHIHRLRALGSTEAMLASNAGHAALVEALAAGDPSAAFEAAWLNAARGMARSFPEPPALVAARPEGSAGGRPRRTS